MVKFRFQDLENWQLAIQIAGELFTDNEFLEVIVVSAMRFEPCGLE
jgi:hypothetical protein